MRGRKMWGLQTIIEINKEPKNDICSNCGTKLNFSKKRNKDRIPCPVCSQEINSFGEILKVGRDLSRPQIW